jgi:hypothetical protein
MVRDTKNMYLKEDIPFKYKAVEKLRYDQFFNVY